MPIAIFGFASHNSWVIKSKAFTISFAMTLMVLLLFGSRTSYLLLFSRQAPPEITTNNGPKAPPVDHCHNKSQCKQHEEQEEQDESCCNEPEVIWAVMPRDLMEIKTFDDQINDYSAIRFNPGVSSVVIIGHQRIA